MDLKYKGGYFEKKNFSKKIIGIIMAVAGGIIIIEGAPLLFWYIILGSLICTLIVYIFI